MSGVMVKFEVERMALLWVQSVRLFLSSCDINTYGLAYLEFVLFSFLYSVF